MIWNRWTQDDREVLVPRDTSWADYGARIAELLNRLAEHEGRSVLAVYVEMVTVPA
jgi:broad specificity phosphatase PhoE